MPVIKAGYMGYAEAGGYQVRCTDFNVKLSQSSTFYDHTIGLRDSIPVDILDGKGDVGAWNEQKLFWRASTKLVEGTINFPIVELSANAFFYEAYTGEDFDLNLYYSCDTGKTFKYCKVNSYSFTATAGEPTTVSVGVMGIAVEDYEAPEPYVEMEKILTFDAIKVGGVGASAGGVLSIDFQINNNCMPIYTAGTNLGVGGTAGGGDLLLPNAIRVGMQTVTGSVTFYNDIGDVDTFVEELEPRVITIEAATFSAELNVIFQYPERTGQVSPYIRTIPFVGVAHAVQSA